MRIRRQVLAIAALSGLAAAAEANVIRVPQDQPTIQAAVDAAVDGCEVQVAPGTYAESVDLRGRRITVRSTAGSATTILDGTGVSGSLFIAQSGETQQTVVRGFTLRNGSGTAATSCFGNQPVGGAVYVFASGLTIEECSLEDNGVAILAGGAIFCEDSFVTVRNSTLLRNGRPDAGNNRSGYGGAAVICGNVGTLRVENCDFRDNGPCGFGGGIMNNFREIVVLDSTFARNGASFGGGIAGFGNTTIERCTFDNHSSSHGGGINLHINDLESGVVRNCSFVGNTASFGGGVNAYTGAGDLTGTGGSIEITNCFVFGNSASFGGGMYVSVGEAGSARVVNATIVGNSDGAVLDSGGPTPIELSNSIVRGNSTSQVAGGFIRFSNVQGNSGPPGNIDADPLFANPGTGDFTLLLGSPSIDTGDNAAVPSGVTTDLGGNARILDGNGDTTATVDMGAFEFGSGGSVTCRSGNVNSAGAGGLMDVLLINGSSGAPTRSVTLTAGSTVQVDLGVSSSGPLSARYILYVWAGPGENQRNLNAQGSLLGCFVNPTPMHTGLNPQPLFCLGGQGLPAAACSGTPTKPSPARAPWQLSRQANRPVTLTLQGILQDSGSAHPGLFSVTNAVTLVVTP